MYFRMPIPIASLKTTFGKDLCFMGKLQDPSVYTWFCCLTCLRHWL